MIPGSYIPLVGDGGYKVQRSLRFRASASAYLSRTPAGAGNRRTWTWSGWVKRGALTSGMDLLSVTTGADYVSFRYNSNDTLRIILSASVNYGVEAASNLFRDPSAWYNVIVAVDTTQATAADRIKIYVNNSQLTLTAISGFGLPVLNYDTYVNATNAHNIGRFAFTSSLYFDGYLADVYFIDGQALTPSSFGQTDPATGQWVPKRYTGTYGTNGFYLDFRDPTTTSSLCLDRSGNGNDWTPNNISVTSGSTYDSMLDVPTPWADGGNGRGNYATLNPLRPSVGTTLINANLTGNGVSGVYATYISTMELLFPCYFEMPMTSANNGAGITDGGEGVTGYLGQTSNSYGYSPNGILYNNGGVVISGLATLTTNDIMQVAFDPTTRKLWIGKNGTWVNSGNPVVGGGSGEVTTVNAGVTYFAGVGDVQAAGLNATTVNFGQRPFTYTPPTGFKALHTGNLPTPSIRLPNRHMDVKLHTGTGATQSVTGVAFQPDFVWVKGRSGATDHALYDAVRGVQLQLESNQTGAETTETTGLTSFNSDGFTFGALAQMNTSTATYVDWMWKANGAGVANTDGTISSTVSANPTAGFSIVTYTGTGANGTVGHGLGVAPGMVIVKNRASVTSWPVYHANQNASPASGFTALESTGAFGVLSTVWNNTAPTSSVFSIGTSGAVNENTRSHVAYCFTEIAGFSRIGSYTGNGSTDGPFVWCGFRPRWVMIKRTDLAGSWVMHDVARSTSNFSGPEISANASTAEIASTERIDFLSNGFKLRGAAGSDYNTNLSTYIFLAFAEAPFRFANAR